MLCSIVVLEVGSVGKYLELPKQTPTPGPPTLPLTHSPAHHFLLNQRSTDLDATYHALVPAYPARLQ